MANRKKDVYKVKPMTEGKRNIIDIYYIRPIILKYSVQFIFFGSLRLAVSASISR